MVLISIVAILAATMTGPVSDRAALERLCKPLRNGAAVDLQGQRFVAEQDRDPARPVTAIDARQSMLLLPDRRFLLRTSTIYPGGIEFRFRTIGTRYDEKTIDELGWRDGDVLAIDDAASAARDDADLRMLVPGMLACDALARRTGEIGAAGFPDLAGRAVALTLDVDGNLTTARVGEESYTYAAWQGTGANRQPGRIERMRGTRMLARWNDVRIRAASSGDTRLLSLPKGYRLAEPPRPLHATPLGDGAYRVDGAPSGYHTGFIVGGAGIAVFDAPVSVAEAKAVRALIERVAPGKRVAYVVVSHVHADHIAGLPAYADAEILVGTGGSVAIQRQLGGDLALRVREVRTGETIDLGERTVRLEPLPSAHALTMLVGFDVRSGTLFQGDLFYIPERGGVTPAFATGRELLTFVEAADLPARAIVGVHGRTGTLNELRAAVASRPTDSNRGGIGTQMSQSKGSEIVEGVEYRAHDDANASTRR